MNRYKLVFYVPESHKEAVKAAVFSAGAGHIGHYDHCCWESLGEGQFRALEGSQPYIGQKAIIEKVAEYRVEMVCSNGCIREVVSALKKAHPYEEPAFDVIQLHDPSNL